MACFGEAENVLAIDPDECIDCAVCVRERSVDAIMADDDLPNEQRALIDAPQHDMRRLRGGAPTAGSAWCLRTPQIRSRTGLAVSRGWNRGARP